MKGGNMHIIEAEKIPHPWKLEIQISRQVVILLKEFPQLSRAQKKMLRFDVVFSPPKA